MGETDFSHLLLTELHNPADPNRRYIFRLKSQEAYLLCFDKLVRDAVPPISISGIQPLESIAGFSCCVEMIEQFMPFLPDVQSIEIDQKQAFVHLAGFYVPWGVNHIRAPEVWRKSTGNRIKIGIIDTGVDYYHPDLQRSIDGGINLVHRHLLPMDDNGHGTHIAGTIAAASRSTGIVGVAPQGSLHAIKAFDHNGTAFVSDIIHGIDWCVRNRMDIINMSFGMKHHSNALEASVISAFNAGKIFVASSGNSGRTTGIDYPARFPQTISVGASTRSRRIAPFSNRGGRIDIYAPGERIYSTWLHGRYQELSGTSMATSHVTGVIALMLAAEPRLTTRQIKTMLQRNALTLGLKKTSVRQPGEVNALRTFKSIFP